MIETTFLDLTLPDAGNRVIAILNPAEPGRMRHKFLTDNPAAAAFVPIADRDLIQVFHACHGYGPKERGRKGDNVVACRSFYLDLDCGPTKSYADARAAVTALFGFARAADLPVPLVVSSGVGLHAYWPMDADMSPNAWRAVALMLKRACAHHGLAADPSRTADIASVLRPVGATHRKGKPRPVKVIHWAEQTPLADFRASLENFLGYAAGPPGDLLGPAPVHLASPSVAGNADLGEHASYPPADAEQIADQCAVMGMIRETRGVTDQPTWYHALQVLNHSEDGQALAHVWSRGDARYTAAEVDKTLTRLDGIGPTTCAKFREHQPALCGACPHTIASPIQLGRGRERAEPASTPLADIEASRLSRLMGGHTYKRPFEFGEWLVIGELTVISSPGGVGKTSLQVSMALSLASGVGFIGQKVYVSRKVLFLNYEESTAELALKFKAAIKHHNIDLAAADRIHLYGSDTVTETTMTTVSAATRQPKVNDAWFTALKKLVGDTGADVVFLDPYTALMAHGMNDNGLTYSVVRALKVVASECHCAIVISAHTRKGGGLPDDGADTVMGASALVNGARVALGLRRVDEATAKAIGAGYGEEGDYREVINQKTNFTPTGKGKYFRAAGVQMNNATAPYTQGDWVAVMERYMPQCGARSLPQAAMKDAYIQLARGSGGGTEPYCQKKTTNGRWFGPDLSAAIRPHMPGLDGRGLEAAAKELVAEGLSRGWIVATPHKNLHRKTVGGLAVDWSATDWASDPAPSGAYLA